MYRLQVDCILASTNNAVDGVSVCSNVIGSTGAECEDYFFSFPTNVATALSSPELSAYLCTHPCLPTLMAAAPTFLNHGPLKLVVP
jgi:hypothetical protein